MKLNNTNAYTCKSTNWMFNNNSNYWWSLSAYYGSNLSVIGISTNGGFFSNGVSSGALAGVKPTLFLSSDIEITGGAGTQTDPYELFL